MNIGLVDVDGHHFPNLALMKLSAWHKSHGDSVDFNQGLDARLACADKYILDLLSRVKWIRYVRFACDRISQLDSVTKVVQELSKRGIKPYRIFVYALIGDVHESLVRIEALKRLGVSPFAQPYRDFENNIEPTKGKSD